MNSFHLLALQELHLVALALFLCINSRKLDFMLSTNQTFKYHDFANIAGCIRLITYDEEKGRSKYHQ